MRDAEHRSRDYRRLSAERQIRSLPRQRGRARQGAHRDPESAGTRGGSSLPPNGAADRAVACMISDWLAFWDSSHSIYVNAQHKDVHYRLIARQIAALVSTPQAGVLDYGSGEALHADLVAAVAGQLFLCEAAPKLLAGVAARFAGHPKIRVLTPREVELLPEHSLDLVVLHSVAQYLLLGETAALFTLFHRLLKPGGVMVVSDVIPPSVAAATDTLALLRFAVANGFLTAALIGLARTLISDYGRLRARIGLTRYGEVAMIEQLAAAGFAAHRAPENIGHNQARMAFITRPIISVVVRDDRTKQDKVIPMVVDGNFIAPKTCMEGRHNILMIANEKYFEFTLLLVKSILKVCDSDKLGNIIIGNIGLANESTKTLRLLSSRIQFLHFGEVITGTSDVHTEEWVQAVLTKTIFLKFCVENQLCPVILLDSDQIVMKDFLSDLPNSSPVTVCKREVPAQRPDGQILDFIASFFVARNQAAKPFLDEWMRLIQARISEQLLPAYETPALCDILNKRRLGLDYDFVPDREYGAPNYFIEGITRIIHLKSEVSMKSDLQDRIKHVKGLPLGEVDEYLKSPIRIY
jgi:SAM-dependent methyltransferase